MVNTLNFHKNILPNIPVVAASVFGACLGYDSDIMLTCQKIDVNEGVTFDQHGVPPAVAFLD